MHTCDLEKLHERSRNRLGEPAMRRSISPASSISKERLRFGARTSTRYWGSARISNSLADHPSPNSGAVSTNVRTETAGSMDHRATILS